MQSRWTPSNRYYEPSSEYSDFLPSTTPNIYSFQNLSLPVRKTLLIPDYRHAWALCTIYHTSIMSYLPQYYSSFICSSVLLLFNICHLFHTTSPFHLSRFCLLLQCPFVFLEHKWPHPTNYGLIYMAKLYGPNVQIKVGNLSSQTTNIISEENKQASKRWELHRLPSCPALPPCCLHKEALRE